MSKSTYAFFTLSKAAVTVPPAMQGTVHSRMKTARQKSGLTQAQVGQLVAEALDKEPLSSQAIAGWEKDQLPTLENFRAWCSVVGADASTVLFGEPNSQFTLEQLDEFGGYQIVPRYNIEAGLGVGKAIHSEQVVDYLAFQFGWLRRQGVEEPVCVMASGDSMTPTIRDGDICLIDMAQRDGDGVFAISRNTADNQSHVMLKRFEKRLSGEVWIYSDNKAHSSGPEVIQEKDVDHLEILGKVVWSGGNVM